MKRLYGSLGFKLILTSMLLALVAISLGGVFAYKISEDAIKVDAQKTAGELAREVGSFKSEEAGGNSGLVDTLVGLKVSKFGAAWVMDRNGFLIAHMDPKYRNMVEAQTYIGDTYVNLNVVDQPIQQLGEKNIVHKARLMELAEKYDGGFGTYNFLGENKIIAFRVLKEKGWVVAVDQPISTAFSELQRIKRLIVMACVAMAVLTIAFTMFAMRVIIRPYYKEQEESNIRLELMNQELSASRRKLEKAGNSLTRLYDLSIAMQYSGFLESHLPLVLGVAQERFDVDRILLFMPDDDGQTMRCRASVGNVFESEEKIYVPLTTGGGAIARCFLTKQPIFIDGAVPADLRLAPPFSTIRSLRSNDFAVFPLVTKEKVIGVICVDNKMSRRNLTRDDVETIGDFAFKMASLIENTIQVQTIRKAAQEMENRDRLTGLFHLRHVKGIAEQMIEAAVREKSPFTAGLVYLANFKEYNELNGYQRGDFVLQKTAESLKAQEVMGVVPARCFGATFLALFPGKNVDQGRYMVEQLTKELDQFAFYGEKGLADGRIVFKTSILEYQRESGASFDAFFKSLEALETVQG